MNDFETEQRHDGAIDDSRELKVRERVERLITEAEGLRVAAAWMLEYRRELAEFGVGNMDVCLFGGTDSDELRFYLYGDDEGKHEACERLRFLIPDLVWEDDSRSTAIGIRAEIVGGMNVLFFGTLKNQRREQ